MAVRGKGFCFSEGFLNFHAFVAEEHMEVDTVEALIEYRNDANLSLPSEVRKSREIFRDRF